jgi:hypothetical protein
MVWPRSYGIQSESRLKQRKSYKMNERGRRKGGGARDQSGFFDLQYLKRNT